MAPSSCMRKNPAISFGRKEWCYPSKVIHLPFFLTYIMTKTMSIIRAILCIGLLGFIITGLVLQDGMSERQQWLFLYFSIMSFLGIYIMMKSN